MKALAAAGVAVLVVVGGAAALSGGEPAPATAPPASTAEVRRGRLSATVSQAGTLTYRAPASVVNRARGTYTELPEVGDAVGCRGVLYRVDDEPVLLLCGRVPAYRSLHVGDSGRDVRQLNRNLRVRGDAFTARTKHALEALQRRRGVHPDGSLAVGDAVFLPEAVRIAKVRARLGGSARPGAEALNVTSGALHVQVRLEASEQGQVSRGDRARITLPGNETVAGTVTGFGRVAAADATIPTFVGLGDPRKARGLDRAPAQVQIATKGVAGALSVPVTALVGRSGGGFAVEVVRAGDRRELVAVDLGLVDTAAGRVQVEGSLRPGDRVAVPSS